MLYRFRQAHHLAAGFTLLELLTLLLLLGIVTAVAVPAWQRLMADNHLTVATNTLVMSLQRARSEAIKRNSVVFVCAGHSRNACAESADWNDGWIVTADGDEDGRPDTGAAPISETSLPDSALLRGSRRSTPIVFHHDGRSPGSNTTWILCDPGGRAKPRQIVLSNEGRIRTANVEGKPRCSG